MPKKCKTREELLKILARRQNKGKKIVFARGCFDILHPGHIYYLEQAKSWGDVLVVWLNSDRAVRQLKGPGRPIFIAQHRARVLASLECVDYIAFFEQGEGLGVIQDFCPDFVAVPRVTADFKKAVLAGGGEVKLIKKIADYSTTRIINLIFKKHAPK